jgi:hypothetical protein
VSRNALSPAYPLFSMWRTDDRKMEEMFQKVTACRDRSRRVATIVDVND